MQTVGLREGDEGYQGLLERDDRQPFRRTQMTGKARGKEEEEQGENTVMENGDKLGEDSIL